MRKYFDEQLLQLNNDIIKMSLLVEEAIENMITTLKNNDIVLNKELLHKDQYINEYERRIETLCFHLLLTQQPMAFDLRHITSTLKIVTDLERIGDQAADIIEMIIKSKKIYHFNDVNHLYNMAKDVKKMVRYSIEAFINHDLTLVKKTQLLEKEVNHYYKEIKNMIQIYIKNSNEDIDKYIDLLMITKHLEKIGDHAVNICGWVEYEESGLLD